jgi:hypothetical protein
MLSRGESVTSTPYEFIPLDNFKERLGRFSEDSQKKIKTKIDEMISLNPYRYPMLIGPIPIAGLRIAGLRHMKVGVKGLKGGAYTLYRICGECKKHEFYAKSDGRCAFCANTNDNYIVLFDVGLRSDDYSK